MRAATSPLLQQNEYLVDNATVRRAAWMLLEAISYYGCEHRQFRQSCYEAGGTIETLILRRHAATSVSSIYVG